MANNYVTKDGTGALITFVSYDSGGGTQLAESCPHDGTNKMTRLFNLDSSGVTSEWLLGVGLRLTTSGGSVEAIGQKTMALSIPVAIASNQSGLTVAQATAASLNATVVGTGTFAVQAACTGTVALGAGSAVIGHVIVDSGTITTVSTVTAVTTVTTVTTVGAVTAITNALPAGSNTIGGVNVISDTAGSGVLLSGVAPSSATALGSNACTKGVFLKADDDNTNSIYLGFANSITADSGASTSGIRLKAGQSVFLPVSNSSLIFMLRGAASQNYSGSAI